VDRHREAFLDLLEHHVDILFANEAEICSLYQARTTSTPALQAVRRHSQVAALTRGARGSVIVAGDEVHVIDATQSRAWSTPRGRGTSTPRDSSSV
jgi:sugar/nucleoside kinase (ribokinase family)